DETGEAGEGGEPGEVRAPAPPSIADDEEVDEIAPAARRGPQSTRFGAVWDSQLVVPSAARSVGPVDEEDFEEPEIPEYLIAEQRRGPQQPGCGGGRGGPRRGRSAHTDAGEGQHYGGASGVG